MSIARVVVRILLGVAWVFFGLNGFLHFLTPPTPTGDAGTFFAGMVASRYLLPLMFGVDVLAGLMLLSGRFVPLALLLLAPILVNILAFHLALDLKGIVPGAVLSGMALFLAWTYRSAFAGVLAARPSLPEETRTAVTSRHQLAGA